MKSMQYTFLILIISGCSLTQRPPVFLNSPCGISYHLPNYNSILKVQVVSLDGKTVYWHLKGDSTTKFVKISYGQLPPNMIELAPAQPLKKGSKVIWDIVYQYDAYGSANAGRLIGAFEVGEPNEFREIK